MEVTISRTIDDPQDSLTFEIVFDQTAYNTAFELPPATADDEGVQDKLYADIQRDSFKRLPASKQLALLSQFAARVEVASASAMNPTADAPVDK